MNVCPGTSANITPFKILGGGGAEKDIFGLNNKSLLEFIHCQGKSKRTVIHAAGRNFDSIVYLSSSTIIIKMIFQSSWGHGSDWEQKL